MLNNWFDLFLNIPGDVVSFLEQLLESEIRNGVLDDASTDLLDSFLEVLHSIISKMRFLQMIIST